MEGGWHVHLVIGRRCGRAGDGEEGGGGRERGGRWGGRVEKALEKLKNRGGEWEEKGTGGDVWGEGAEGFGDRLRERYR